MKLLPMELFFPTYNRYYIFSADIIPSAIPADQPVAPSVLASQRQEISLKQVSHPISIFHH